MLLHGYTFADVHMDKWFILTDLYFKYPLSSTTFYPILTKLKKWKHLAYCLRIMHAQYQCKHELLHSSSSFILFQHFFMFNVSFDLKKRNFCAMIHREQKCFLSVWLDCTGREYRWIELAVLRLFHF